MKELVVVSGKGGTGKTSLVASFAALADRATLADCDVDASDLHLVLSPDVVRREPFGSGHLAVIRRDDCIACGACLARCRFEAVRREDRDGESTFSIDPVACEGCGVCVRECPVKAVDFPERTCGEWMIGETRFGPMVFARLDPGSGNSGKLVSLVRREARRIAEEQDSPLLIVDGPPGIGCPVIASITGADMVLAVTEPTPSGEHDLARVLDLARHFRIPSAMCVNKWDINPGLTVRMEHAAETKGTAVVGRIPHDRSVTAAQVAGVPVVEQGDSPAARAVREVWKSIQRVPLF